MADTTIIDSTLYLTFKLDKELLALDVSQVREILDLPSITRVPRTSEFMRGVINLRGSVVPVIDLRLKFGLSKTESSIDSRIVVIEIALDGTEAVVGVLADSVHDVIEIESDQIDSSPRMGTHWRTEFVHGIGKHGDDFILLLDLNRVFSAEEVSVGETSIHSQGSPPDLEN